MSALVTVAKPITARWPPLVSPATLRCRNAPHHAASPSRNSKSAPACRRGRTATAASRRSCSSTAATAMRGAGRRISCPGSRPRATPRTRFRCAATARRGGRETLFVTGLDDFAADVERVAAGLPSPPVLIGHSMGAAVIERLLATRPVRAAALLVAGAADGTPADGRAARRRAARVPDADCRSSIRRGSPRTCSTCCGRTISAPTSRREILRRSDESPLRGIAARAARSVAAAALAAAGAQRRRRCSCWAPKAIASANPDDVRATASHHGVEATIVPGLAHMLMLERQWEKAGARAGALACDALGGNDPRVAAD